MTTATAPRVIQPELVLWQPYPGPGYIDLPQYRSGLSHPALLWFRGAVWYFVQGSGEAGVVEYRPRGEQR